MALDLPVSAGGDQRLYLPRGFFYRSYNALEFHARPVDATGPVKRLAYARCDLVAILLPRDACSLRLRAACAFAECSAVRSDRRVDSPCISRSDRNCLLPWPCYVVSHELALGTRAIVWLCRRV